MTKRTWVTVGITLQATLSLAADLPNAVTHADFPIPSATSVLLGRDLFYDPILSGNRNIACATCHHPDLGTSDAMSLSIGEGGVGLGLHRVVDPNNPPPSRIPRNAPALFNVGALEYTVMFHDGRLEMDDSAPYGIKMPSGAALERPLPHAVHAQAMMPPTSNDEMAGEAGENSVANAIAAGKIRGMYGAWNQLAARVNDIPEYRRQFDWIIGPDEPVHMTDIARAIGDFITFEFRATDSPFDRFLEGDESALTPDQRAGMDLFYGKAACSSCHSGKFQTDHGFHAIGMPQIGPGKAADHSYADYGRFDVTGDPADMFKFRTPSLRNVTLSAPYGHAGAFADLEDVIRHHLDPFTSLAEYKLEGKALLHDVALEHEDDTILRDYDAMLTLAVSNEIVPVRLTDAEIDQLLAFLTALEDRSFLTERLGVPETVPSGLPLDPRPAQSELEAITMKPRLISGLPSR